LEVVHFLAPGFKFYIHLSTVCLNGGFRSIPMLQVFQKLNNQHSEPG
jgi:hypothetical protein